jgi:hypothetical protein
MRYSWIVTLMATAGVAHPSSGSPKPGKDGKFTIESKGIKAQVSLLIYAPDTTDQSANVGSSSSPTVPH